MVKKTFVIILILIAISTVALLSCMHLQLKGVFLKESMNQRDVIVKEYQSDAQQFIVDGVLRKLKEDDRVLLQWVYGATDVILFEEAPQIEKDGYFRSVMTNGGYLWPLGDYGVKIWINDDVVRTLSFEVKPVQ